MEKIAEDESALPEVDDRKAQRLGCGSAPPPAELDSSTWDEIFADDEAKDPPKQESSSILTLSDVFGKVRIGDQELKSIDPIMNSLWLCLINLRTGSDANSLPRPEKFRYTSRPLNWHNICDRQAAFARAVSGLPAKRTSRAQAWRNLSASLKQSCDWTSDEQEVASGLIALFVPPKLQEWRVGVVLSVWRYTAHKQKKTGAKPCTLPVKREVARYVRIAEMSPVPSAEEGMYGSTCTSTTMVCEVASIGLFLSVEDVNRGIDGLQVKLSKKSMEAVEKAHQWTDWPASLQACRAANGRGKQTKRKAGDMEAMDLEVNENNEADADMGTAEVAAEGSQKPEMVGQSQKTVAKKKESKALVKHLHEKTTAELKKSKKTEEIPVPWLFGVLLEVVGNAGLKFNDPWFCSLTLDLFSRKCQKQACAVQGIKLHV